MLRVGEYVLCVCLGILPDLRQWCLSDVSLYVSRNFFPSLFLLGSFIKLTVIGSLSAL